MRGKSCKSQIPPPPKNLDRRASRRFRLKPVALAFLALFTVPHAFGKDCTIPGGTIVDATGVYWFGNYKDDAAGCTATGSASDDYDPTNASNNTLTVESGVIVSGSASFFGSKPNGTNNGDNNQVFLYDTKGTINIYGAISTGGSTSSVINNKVALYNSTVAGNVSGGFTGSGAMTGNQLSLYDSMVTSTFTVSGGYTNTTAVTNNRLFLYGNSTASSGTGVYGVNGGVSEQNDATYNQIVLHDESQATGRIFGGASLNANSTGSATYNQIALYDKSMLTGSIYGGYSSRGSATYNPISLYDECTLTGSVYGGGGTSSTADIFTGNTLNIHRSGQTVLSVENLYNFQYLNFTLPGDIQGASVPLLTVTNELKYDVNDNGDGTTLDIRTPGDVSLGGKTYTLISKSGQSLDDITTYSLYDASFSGSGTDPRTLEIEDTGRVRGNFTISLGGADDNTDLNLTVTDYQAPNTALIWAGGDGLWANYSTDIGKSPENWSGKVSFDGGTPVDVKQYLDGDSVTFNDIPGTSAVTVTVGKEGVMPASVIFNNSDATTYTLGSLLDADAGGPIGGATSLVKTHTGTLKLRGMNTYTGGTEIRGGLINFDDLANFGNYTQGKIALDGGGLQWETGNTIDISPWLASLGSNGGTFDTDGNNVTFRTAISGSGSLTKTGSGKLTLSEENTYAGPTIVEAGILALKTDARLTSAALILHAGAEFMDSVSAPTMLTRLDVVGNSISAPATYTGNLTLDGGTMTFYVPETMKNQGKMLSVSEATLLRSNSAAHLSLADWTSPLELGDTIVLIDSPNGLTVDSAHLATGAETECRKNSMHRCHFDFDWMTFSTQLRAVLTRIYADERAKSFVEGHLSGQALLAQSTDTLLARGVSAARRRSPLPMPNPPPAPNPSPSSAAGGFITTPVPASPSTAAP